MSSREGGDVCVGERSGDCRGLCTCGLGDGNGQWVMNRSSWQRGSPPDSPVREWELSDFHVGWVFYDTLRTRWHKAHKSRQLLETETICGPDALGLEQLRWHWIVPVYMGPVCASRETTLLLWRKEHMLFFEDPNWLRINFTETNSFPHVVQKGTMPYQRSWNLNSNQTFKYFMFVYFLVDDTIKPQEWILLYLLIHLHLLKFSWNH